MWQWSPAKPYKRGTSTQPEMKKQTKDFQYQQWPRGEAKPHQSL